MKTTCLLLVLIFLVKAEAFASCGDLNFQWIPDTAKLGIPIEGVLSVTREATSTGRYGSFYLSCNNTRVVDPSVSDLLIPAHMATSVNFSLQLWNVNEPSSCNLQYCFATNSSVYVSCTKLNCYITLPQPSMSSKTESSVPPWIDPNISPSEPVYFQWIPLDGESGDLIITYYNERENKNYQYEISCDGLVVSNYIFSNGAGSYRVMNASLSVDRNTRPEQYKCVLTVCIERQRSNGCQETSTYSVRIPDIKNQRVIQRPNLLYRYWEKPGSAVELRASDNQTDCDNIKFYWIMDQGQFIIQYDIPSTTLRSQGRFSISCDAQVRQAEIPDVALQRDFDVITMLFTLEYFNMNTYCSMDLCLHEQSSENKCSLQEASCSPIFLFEDGMQEELVDGNYISLREAEKCRMNTWLWVVHSSDEGEAHFIFEEDILAAAKYNGKISLSCARLTVTSLNPLSTRYALGKTDIASFVVQNARDSSKSQECILDVCIQGYRECKLIYSCYISIPIDDGFQLSTIDHSNDELEDCPESIWKWRHTSNGGVLSIRIRQEDRGMIGVHCTGITVNGDNEVYDTNTGTFYLTESLYNQSMPHCEVHICVRQDHFVGCKKSFDCVLMIPSKYMPSRTMQSLLPRAAQSYEEPSKELLAYCQRENLESDSVDATCSDKTWDIFYTTRYAIGEVTLQINLQGNDRVDEFVKVSVHCSGVFIKESKEYRLVIPKTLKEKVVEFNISLPRSSNEEPETHQCTLQMQRRPVPHSGQANNTMCPSTMSCNIPVKTVLGRILPKCNATEGRKSIYQIEVVQKQARVEITISASPNNVYSVDPYCTKNNPFGHNTSKELWSNMFPSTITGEGQVIIAIAFSPECDNKTIASYYLNKRLGDCHMDLYWYCQGGEQVIKRLRNLLFSDEAMHCKPKSIIKTLILSVQTTFGINSEPVAISLAIMIGVVGLYILLIPAACVAVYCHCRSKFGTSGYDKFEDDDYYDDEGDDNYDDDMLLSSSSSRLKPNVQSDQELLI